MKRDAREWRFAFRFCLFLASLALVAGMRTGEASAATKVNFLRNATASFAAFTSTQDPQEQAWMRDHYWRMRGYPPFHDQALPWGPPTHFVQDLYAIYRDEQVDGEAPDQDLIAEHPNWVLRDTQGNALYIPYACGGGSCPAFAADPGNPGWRAYWVSSLAQRQLSKGYAGVFIDNVNMEMMVGNGSGAHVDPIDPRTGQPMTLTDWRRYVAEFTEQIRAALPGIEIAHNAGQWWTSHSDPYYQREIAVADFIELERGFNDPGLAPGDGTFGFLTYLDHIDWLHGRGKSVILEPYDLDAEGRHYALASHLMVREGSDALASDSKADPDDWWVGWGADIGESETARFKTDGYYKRKFSDGIALMNGLGGGNDTINLSSYYRWKTVSGATVTSVTIGPREGRVLYKFPL